MNKLLKTAGMLSFLSAIFLNTVVDLGHKIVIQNTIFKVYNGQEQVLLTALVNGLILLPFILLFSVAGLASDKYPKVSVMRGAAWLAVALTIGITYAYAQGWFWVAFAMTFLLAVQSAFYSPAKYGYIKLLFGQQKLAMGNGVVQAVSIIGILSGTLLFSILFEAWYPSGISDKGAILSYLVNIGYILIATSIIELIMMYRLPQLEPNTTSPTKNINDNTSGLNPVNSSAWLSLTLIFNNKGILLSIIGLALFWSIGQVMLAAFPAFAKAQTGETNTIIIQAIIAASGLGIAIGALIAARFSRNYIETGLIPLGASGIALGLFILPNLHSHLWMGINFLFIGMMAGIFIVPLNSMIQFYASSKNIGRILAANNLLQNISMLSFLLLTVAFSVWGIESKQLLVLIAIVALIGFAYTVYQLPQSLVRFIFSRLINSGYNINVIGMKNIPSSGGVLLLGNHISWIDWAIIQISCPRPVRFVMIRNIYERWYLKWFFDLFGCVPIQAGASSKQSLETISKLLNNGEVVCLFPEGTISRNGHLCEFKRGFEKAAQAADDTVTIIPFYIRGLWGSQFSRSSTALKAKPSKGLRRELSVAFGKAINKNSSTEKVKKCVFDLSIHTWQHYANTMSTIPEAWIDTVKLKSANTAIIDTLGQQLSSTKALTAAATFAKRIRRISPEQNIGLLLPTSSGGVIANMAALLAGKTIVNLNYTASTEAISSAINQAQINTIYTSTRFVKKLQQRGIVLDHLFDGIHVVYLEELKNTIKPWEMLLQLMAIKLLPTRILKYMLCNNNDMHSTAAILFSSGSEGLPKGVKLSHQNIMTNVKQIAEVLNAQEDDVIMASLPLFHAFGLTATQFMPLIEGIPMVCHADPTDSFGIGKAVATHQATVMFGTSTFLRLYSRDNKVKPLMFDSLRLIVAGAEKLDSEVRKIFKLKFGKDIYEGYGATETAPVASVNMPDQLNLDNWKTQTASKVGTVGMPLPGSSFKIVDPNSFDELPTNEDGMILIGGPQIMQGYLNNPSKTHQVIKKIDGVRWYISGDKGHVDEHGFLTIVDRYSRFAKIAGEMISLSEVEQAVTQSMPLSELEVIAINIPDAKKGERLVLLTNQELPIASIKRAMLDNTCNPLLIPSACIHLDELPKLGSGKTDFATAKKMALEVV